MEWIIFVGLLLVAATNMRIATQIRNQKTYNQIEVLPATLECTTAPAPEVVVNNTIELDYEKLAEAIKQGNQPNPVFIQNPLPPVMIQPLPAIDPNSIKMDDGHVTTNDTKIDVYGTEIPVKVFPAR